VNRIGIENWTLTDLETGERIPASVPGDITVDLYKAGRIPDPYYGLNHRDLKWVTERDFDYTAHFTVSGEVAETEELFLVLEGVDLFSEVFVNGNRVGATENMFTRYRFDIKPYAARGRNELRVKMRAVRPALEKYGRDGWYAEWRGNRYFACFSNPARLFLRKAQCHFGWDWAPDLPGYGLWGAAYVLRESKRRIEDARVLPHSGGAVAFITEVNYNARGRVDCAGRPVPGSRAESCGERIRASVAKRPGRDCEDFYITEVPATRVKNIVNVFVEKPELWWPNGYGAQPLYEYKVELIGGDGAVLSEKAGRLAFRTVGLAQEPKGDGAAGYCLTVNGAEIYAKGSNWAPLDCFTGAIPDEKYARALKLACDMNLNALRVWGGGIYEKEIFYDLCDEYGILVWQDFMLSCADIPEDDADWVKNMLAECEYQIKRLRNRPCVAYWAGCNEKPGCFGHWDKTHGDNFLDVTLRGLVHHLDGTRPYAKQSPAGLTDVDGDWESGDSHASAFDAGLADIGGYRKAVAERSPAFVSECVAMGPGHADTYERIFPPEQRWPVGEYWEDRLSRNPHGLDASPFVRQELRYVRALYGEARSLGGFCAAGMQAQAECLRAEAEHCRAIKDVNSGFLNWMYSDIWPCGTCAVVDWHTEPKQAYYQLRRSFAPALVTFAMDGDGRHNAVAVNDTGDALSGEIEYGQRTLGGQTLWSERRAVSVGARGVLRVPNERTRERADAYLYARAVLNGREYKAVYSPSMWKGAAFESDYKYEAGQTRPGELRVKITAGAFAKSVSLRLPDNWKYEYSDNYVDLEAGETREIVVRSAGGEAIDPSGLAVSDFAGETR
jgi:beta-mannosidase